MALTAEEITAKREGYNLSKHQLGILMGFPMNTARKRVYEIESGRVGVSNANNTLLTMIFEKLEAEK